MRAGWILFEIRIHGVMICGFFVFQKYDDKNVYERYSNNKSNFYCSIANENIRFLNLSMYNI